MSAVAFDAMGTLFDLEPLRERLGAPALEAWFEHDCSTVATAGAIFVHRHTVAYRLERVKELSGLDPLKSEDRERLGLGLKAGKVINPRSAS